MKKFAIFGVLLAVLVVGYFLWQRLQPKLTAFEPGNFSQSFQEPIISQDQVVPELVHDLQIAQMKLKSYPGSEILVQDELSAGSNYQRYVVSYLSEGLKINALLTIPNHDKPESGWPVIIFNHGYIPPSQYRTTERYESYVDMFARNGYIVLRSDYRGHGSSEGDAAGGYGSPAYTIDVLNAVGSIKQHPDADPNRIGMWGHSMGGFITLRSMVVTSDIKAGVIWGGVVASYPDLINSWRRRSSTPPPMPSGARRWRDVLQQTYGTPEDNPDFWNSISANSYVHTISGPVQLHHAKGDTSVPWQFSQSLADDLTAAGQPNELFLYEGDNHDISGNFSLAMRRSVEFFDRYLKSENLEQ